MIIDLHTHVVPEHFPAAAGRGSAERWPFMDHFEAGRARVMIAGENFRTVTEQCWGPPRRTRDIAAEGVDAQVLSPMPELLSYWFTPEDGREMSRYVNDFIATMVQGSPGTFYGLGMVPLQDPDLAARELVDLKGMGLRGIELGSNVLGKSLGEPRFLPFFAEAARLDLAIFVHALHPTMRDRFVGPAEVENAVGFPTDTGLTIASLITGRVLERYPSLRMAFSHGGGTFPYFLPRLEHAWSGQWNGAPRDPAETRPLPLHEVLPESPTDYARMLYYDTLLFDGRAIRYLCNVVGSSQLMVGTDYPFVPREKPVGKTLRALEFSDEEIEAITWQNCCRFLGLEEIRATV